MSHQATDFLNGIELGGQIAHLVAPINITTIGLEAPMGSISYAINNTQWRKFGPLDIDWEPLAGTSSVSVLSFIETDNANCDIQIAGNTLLFIETNGIDCNIGV